MSEDDRYADLLWLLGEPRPALEAAGELTPEVLHRAFDGLWRDAQARQWARPHGTRDFSPEPERASCKAVLFSLPDPLAGLRQDLIETGTPVGPVEAAYLAPVQGPSPLWCELGEHPAETWHREGRTWWR